MMRTYFRDRGQWSRAILNSGARVSAQPIRPTDGRVIKPGNTFATAIFHGARSRCWFA